MKKINSLIAATLLCTASVSAFSEEKLTAVSFGGAYGAAQQKHMIDPYTAKAGVKVLFEDYSGGIAEIKAQVESGNVLWDVIDIETIDLERACSEGLLEVFPQDTLPAGDNGAAAKDDFYADALSSECGVGNIYWTVLYAYSDETIKGGTPSTIADFFDTKKFPGKRAMRKRPQINLEWALLADGVAAADVYAMLETDAGLQRAFKKLDTIKNDLVWFDSWSQAPQLLNDGGAVMVQSANGRIYAAINDDKKPFKMVWDGHVFDLDAWAVLKDAPNKAKAIEFVKFATGSKPLSGMQDVAYGPTRESSMVYVDDAVKGQLPSANLDVGMRASGDFWSDFGESYGEKFNEWLLK